MAVHVTALAPGVPTGSVPTIMAQPVGGSSTVVFQLAVSVLESTSASQAGSSNSAQPKNGPAMQHYETQAASECEEPSFTPEKESAEDAEVTGIACSEWHCQPQPCSGVCMSQPAACVFVVPCADHPDGRLHGRPMSACEL